jgi:hypothetical protein
MHTNLQNQTRPKIYDMSFASVYKLYIQKAERKGRTKADVDEIILWLTGYTKQEFEKQIENMVSFEEFFAQAKLNPLISLVKGVVCGVRVEDIQDPLMKEIRYLDKLIDELAKGKAMDKILRKTI